MLNLTVVFVGFGVCTFNGIVTFPKIELYYEVAILVTEILAGVETSAVVFPPISRIIIPSLVQIH